MEYINKFPTSIGAIGEKYEIISEINLRGGEGLIFLIKEKTTDKFYAAKFPKDKKTSLNNEINILKILKNKNCKNIVNIIDSGESKIIINSQLLFTKQYLILEFAQRRDLSEYLQFSGSFEEIHSKILFYKIVKCIESIHNCGICHRDIKPDNILFDADFNIKINDFGHAGIYKPLLKGLYGSPNYMSPEMIKGKEYDGYKIDIFSLGVVFFGLTVGNLGFSVATTNNILYQYIYKKNEEGYWKKYKEYNKKFCNIKISNEFKKLYFKMVAYEPDERPSIDQILNDEWFGSIRGMKDDQLIEYENKINLNEELLKRYNKIMESIVVKVKKKNDNNQDVRGIDEEKEGFFCKFATPEYIERITFMNYYINLIGFNNLIKFMNDLCQKIIDKFGNDKCYVREDNNNKLKFELLFKGEDNSEYNPIIMEIILYKTKEEEYLLRFIRKKISKYDFIEKFKIISDLANSI